MAAVTAAARQPDDDEAALITDRVITAGGHAAHWLSQAATAVAVSSLADHGITG